ncbi:phage tail protein [Treponema succinifaciens]|uniref:phage tail protein n=1 Tax=Treponema succinifaciens TaxID=167 RepID=UPI003FCC69D3
MNHTTRKFKGRTQFPNLILEKGITENESLFNWFKETCLENKKLERENGSVVLKDTEGKRGEKMEFLPCLSLPVDRTKAGVKSWKRLCG